MSDIIISSENDIVVPQDLTSERGVSIDGLVKAWLHSKDQRSHSAQTRKAYEDTITKFREFLQEHGYDLIWKGDDFIPTIADFAQSFAATRSEKSKHKGDIAPATQSQRLAILSSFYLYAIKRRHLLAGNPIDSVERAPVEPYAQAKAIDQNELARRLRAIDASTLQGSRDLAILCVLLSTGRRVSEVASLTKADLEFSGEQIRLSFNRTKGAKSMRDTLNSDVSMILGNWISMFYEGQFMGLPDNTPVWVNVHHKGHKGQLLGYHGFAGICKHYLGTSKVHVTRHCFAILMEIANAKLTDIQQRLQRFPRRLSLIL